MPILSGFTLSMIEYSLSFLHCCFTSCCDLHAVNLSAPSSCPRRHHVRAVILSAPSSCPRRHPVRAVILCTLSSSIARLPVARNNLGSTTHHDITQCREQYVTLHIIAYLHSWLKQANTHIDSIISEIIFRISNFKFAKNVSKTMEENWDQWYILRLQFSISWKHW